MVKKAEKPDEERPADRVTSALEGMSKRVRGEEFKEQRSLFVRAQQAQLKRGAVRAKASPLPAEFLAGQLRRRARVPGQRREKTPAKGKQRG